MYSPASSHEPAKAVSSKAKPSQAKVIAWPQLGPGLGSWKLKPVAQGMAFTPPDVVLY
jgi:hypothetical protein